MRLQAGGASLVFVRANIANFNNSGSGEPVSVVLSLGVISRE
jgi:hypothetical protein